VAKCPRLAGVGGKGQAPTARSTGGLVKADVDARKLANLRETEQIGQDRLGAAIFVGAVGMQSIPATAGLGIDQRDGQVVAAEEPCEGARRHGFPFGIAIRPPCGEQAAMVAAASPAAGRRRGEAASARRTQPCRRRKWPAGAVCCVISQARDLNPASV